MVLVSELYISYNHKTNRILRTGYHHPSDVAKYLNFGHIARMTLHGHIGGVRPKALSK